jgi:hypothetical protein
MKRLRPFAALAAAALLTAAGSASPDLNPLAEQYVKLALAAGVHDGDYVDAYYGPPEWRTAAEAARVPLPEVRAQLAALAAALGGVDTTGLDGMSRLRHAHLAKQVQALAARLREIAGEKLSFDEESLLIYDTIAPRHPAEYYDKVLAELDRALPGTGPLAERYQAFRDQFIIPPAKLDAVFQAAITAARERTLRHIPLPPGESFTVEYVTDKPWGGYNWYQGGYRSVIQVNTDLPIYVDRAVDLAAHEGYPGHHVYGCLLEEKLLRGRGWIEFSLNPLFGPNGIIAEGSANYGREVVFPGEERLKFEREVIFPLAGLDPRRVEEYYRVLALTKDLAFAGNEAARRYLAGELTLEQAKGWLERYTLVTPARAEKALRFAERYRSYVITYNHGQQLVHDYIEARAQGDPERRWREFTELISTPRLPSQLR